MIVMILDSMRRRMTIKKMLKFMVDEKIRFVDVIHINTHSKKHE